MLSPCIWQVTHALLTRPPLSHKQLHPEEICRKCFVRLACVKHAASVHPEPGSNSQLKFVPVIINFWLIIPFLLFLRSYSRFLSALFPPLPDLPILSVFWNSFEFSGLSYCSIIMVLCVVVSNATTIIQYHIRITMSTHFLHYFSFFSLFGKKSEK